MDICRLGSWECEWHCLVLGGKVVLLVIGDGEVRLLVGLIMLIEDELVLGRGDFGVL
jgi:hypothetical protein